MISVIDGGITAPIGFNATGAHIGIRKVKKDISLLTSDVPAIAAGTFTQSVVTGAHIPWDKERIKAPVRGVITISGNANAATGERGIKDNEKIAALFANEIGVDKNEILTAATGIIGLHMNMPVIENGIKEAVKTISHRRREAKNAAQAIMTTDTFLKEYALKLNVAGKTVKIGAMAKGGGMIHPNMATVLCFITTDINISQPLLQEALSDAIKDTYNMISVDGATSTNDMALILSNGMAGNIDIDRDSEFYDDFKKAVLKICKKFARDIVHDGEGSSKFIQATVSGARTIDDARLLSKSIITNNLVKTAMYGEDANWGRVLAAMGNSGGYFNPFKVDMSFESEGGKLHVMCKGEPTGFNENLASDVLHEHDIFINVSLGDGDCKASAWGCDLGHEYVRINGEYRSRT